MTGNIGNIETKRTAENADISWELPLRRCTIYYPGGFVSTYSLHLFNLLQRGASRMLCSSGAVCVATGLKWFDTLSIQQEDRQTLFLQALWHPFFSEPALESKFTRSECSLSWRFWCSNCEVQGRVIRWPQLGSGPRSTTQSQFPTYLTATAFVAWQSRTLLNQGVRRCKR